MLYQKINRKRTKHKIGKNQKKDGEDVPEKSQRQLTGTGVHETVCIVMKITRVCVWK